MPKFSRNSLARDLVVLGTVVGGMVLASVLFTWHAVATHHEVITVSAAGVAHGHDLFVQNCASCHGANAQGMPHQGADLRLSKFIESQSDSRLINFIRTGRQPQDPNTVMGLNMPPKGGNMTLKDEHLADIVAYLRQVQKSTKTPGN